jgi:D-alanine-D-alanine ligase
MPKKNIALVTGGDSGEYVISMKSAGMIRENLDKNKYNVFTILMHHKKWIYIDEENRETAVDKSDFTIRVRGEKLFFDCVFITIHGTPGEDGKLQAYFDLLGIPYNTAGVLASALTFNKFYCNRVVAQLGFDVPGSVKLCGKGDRNAVAIIDKLGLPLFVKPNEGGSSLGMTFVKKQEDLLPAIDLAFKNDKSVLVEEYLDGIELTCGVFQYDGQVKALPVTEIVSKTAAKYFDFEAKYTPGAADEITPARISDDLTKRVKDLSVTLYQQLEMFGLVRFDYIFCREKLYFIEVNVTPGMTETSLVPQAAAIEGISNTELFTMLIEEALRQTK